MRADPLVEVAVRVYAGVCRCMPVYAGFAEHATLAEGLAVSDGAATTSTRA